jgi:hypothetical protein
VLLVDSSCPRIDTESIHSRKRVARGTIAGVRSASRLFFFFYLKRFFAERDGIVPASRRERETPGALARERK